MYLNNSKQIVIKIGSSLLIDDKKNIRKKWLLDFAKDIRELIKNKKRVIIVSSGAIVLGCKKLNISKKNYDKVTSIALKAHKLLKCRGVTRSDFRFNRNKFYLLETNTQPGMTSLSLVPEIAKYRNISFAQLINKILLDASINK